jgi:hypothetical protein
LEKALADYQAQANKPFDHEARMKDLILRQAQLNATLDLDKNETQVAPPTEDVFRVLVSFLGIARPDSRRLLAQDPLRNAAQSAIQCLRGPIPAIRGAP